MIYLIVFKGGREHVEKVIVPSRQWPIIDKGFENVVGQFKKKMQNINSIAKINRLLMGHFILTVFPGTALYKVHYLFKWVYFGILLLPYYQTTHT